MSSHVKKVKARWLLIVVMLLICGGNLLWPQIAGAQSDCVTLEWDWSSPEYEAELAGFRIYQTTDKANWPPDPALEVDKTSRQAKISGLDLPGTLYYFRATAYSISGAESDYSNVVSTWKPVAPGIRILPCLGP